MDKYEYRVKTEQLLECAEKKQFQKAMEIADTIDWRRVKNASMLNTVSEVYEYCGEYQKSRDILFVAYDRAPESRKVVYRLGTLALKIGDTDEAADCYEEFVKVAPKDPNQYILKYKILKAQHAPLAEQIAALEDFKKAEYIEKWAYELAKLYHEAGMTRECLEECDDLILWFSEGKYVRLAMELKMKYKPLTPLQQEKYDSQNGYSDDEEEEPEQEDSAEESSEEESEPEDADAAPSENSEQEKDAETAAEEEESEAAQETVAEEDADDVLTGSDTEEPEEAADDMEEISAFHGEDDESDEIPEDIHELANSILQDDTAADQAERPHSSIVQRVVSGATLEEALKSTVAILNQEEKRMAQQDEQLRISGQMKIDDILAEWEEKQEEHAKAIEIQKAEDEARLQKEREAANERIEAAKKAAEEAARKASEEAARKAAEEAARKAEEEAAKKAAEEAARKAEEEAAKKAAEEAARKEAEEAARKAAEEKAAEEAARKEAEEKAAAEAVLRVSEESLRQAAKEKAEKEKAAEEAAKLSAELSAVQSEAQDAEPEGQTQRLPDDIMALVEQLESRVAAPKVSAKDLLDETQSEEDAEEDFEDLDEDAIENDVQKDDLFDAMDSADDSYEDDFDEAFSDEEATEEEASEEEDFEDEDFEEDDFIDTAGDEDFDEDEDFEAEDFEEDDFEEEDFEEEDFEEDDFEEEDFEEEDFEEEDFEEEDFEQEDFEEEDFEEEDFEEEDFEKEGFEEETLEDEDLEEDLKEEDFEEENLDEADLEEADVKEEDFEEEKLPREEAAPKIEEPSEEEIQKRIKKSKGGGVPFDTGFVVTGRYDLSATSEIGLKAGLTEEQKKLFSYFVPVRGMSEQIVEVLDNDRRAQREGTSRTGNLLVIGRKGSGKTVLAVDIVKAIQKQRNLRQGKVAIVTGESLNKKELPNIIQKLRGGAIIVEKAGKLNTRTVKELNHLMERKTGEMLFVLEDQRKPLQRMLTANPEFRKKFTSKLELPTFINDELVTFGQTYAKENGYKLDEMGILALYSRIDVLQREDHAVTVAEVKEIMDEAIAHSQKANVKHLARRVFGKGTDESDRIILKEEDFKV